MFFLPIIEIFTTKVIHSALIPSKRTGWVEIDLYATLKYWKKSRNNYGLSIDVYDEKDQQLDAREYFELQNCNQEAGKSVMVSNSFNINKKKSFTTDQLIKQK